MAAIPTVQKVYVGLADGDVSRGGVCVELLMPLLQKLVLNPLKGQIHTIRGQN